MQYKNLNINIPQEQRKSINEKIIYMIDNDIVEKNGFSKEIIFNTYSGVGGTFDIKFNDYNSFYAYTEKKKELEQGQFFTQYNESKLLADCLNINKDETVLDLTCGMGSLFNFLPNLNNAYGNEIDIKSYKVCKYLFPKVTLNNEDMRNYNTNMLFDIVIGNPPFNIRMAYGNREKNSQMVYVEKAAELLKTFGFLAIIVPYSFLNDEFSNKSDIEYMDKNFNFIGQIELDNKAFQRVGVNNFKTKMIFFVKKSEFIEEKKYINEFTAGEKIKKLIQEIRYIKDGNKNKIRLENLQNYTNEHKEFDNRVKKLLFDIRRTKATEKYYNECYSYYQLFYNQKQPNCMSCEDWNEIRVTKDKVLNKLKTILKEQHGKKLSKLRMNEFSEKKIKEFNLQSIPFDKTTTDKNIESWLSNKTLYNELEEKNVKLNDLQRKDLNKVLQKKYSYLQWEMGSGKSFSSLFYGLYRMEKNHCKNIFVVAPAIAIKSTYVDMLENFSLPYRVIEKKTDIDNIQEGEFLLFTFNMVIKNERYIKRFFRIKGKKFAFILDEADSISNPNSKRCKSVLNCFRRSVKYKLLLSATSVRNSINEVYTQLELLYNNSSNMISKNTYVYIEDKEQKNIKEVLNEEYNKKYKPYKKGYELFTKSFIPKKISTFGVAKFEQNVYNKDILKEMIDKTIMTRSLEDIIGKKLYNMNQVSVNFTESEIKLYSKILKEFETMSSEYHIKTGNSRKDSLFKILAILNTLLKACSTPHVFDEYQGKKISTKILKVIDMVSNFKNERVAIGCTRVKSVYLYENILREKFPNRKIYIITGQETTLKQRKKMVEDMKEYNDCIVISTQQSLSCSMNIGFINKVIIPEMQWNSSSLNQYLGRFSRMNSEKKTDIYNVFYSNSIEVNLLKLNMVKEKLCLLMKNEDLADTEMYEKFNIDPVILEGLMIKEKDGENRVNIKWGNQEIK